MGKKKIILLLLIAIMFIPKTVYGELSIDEYLDNEGYLFIDSVSPTSLDEASLMVEDYFQNKYGKYISVNSCNDDYTICELKYNDTEIPNIKIKYNVGSEVNKEKILSKVSKLENNEEIEVSDIDAINYYLYNNKIPTIEDDLTMSNYKKGLSLSYSNYLKDEINNTPITVGILPRAGENLYFFDYMAGHKLIKFNDTIYSAGEVIRLKLLRMIFVPNGTTNYLEAAQNRIREYFGDTVSITYGGLVSDINKTNFPDDPYFKYEDSISSYDMEYLLELLRIPSYDGNYYNVNVNGKLYRFLIIENSSFIKSRTEPTLIDPIKDVEIYSLTNNKPYNLEPKINDITADAIYKDMLNATKYKVYDISLNTNNNNYDLTDKNYNFRIPLPEGYEEYFIYNYENDKFVKCEYEVEDGYIEINDKPLGKYAIAEKNLSITSSEEEVDYGEAPTKFDDNISKKVNIINNGNVPVKISLKNPTEAGPFGNIYFDEDKVLEPDDTLEVTLIAKSGGTNYDKEGTYTGNYEFTATLVDTDETYELKIPTKIEIKKYPVSVSYTTHVQSYGWQNYVYNGETSGTTGEAKRLEAIKIKLLNQDHTGDIEYKTHIQKIGWEDEYKKNDEMSGTEGMAYRLEAIQIKLTGHMAEHYDIYYRVHAQKLGWLGWAKNDEQAGTSGYGYRLEGIEIQLVEKGNKPLENDNQSDKLSYYSKLIEYTTHVQTYGWQDYVYDGQMAGTTGEKKRLEGIKINLVNQKYSGDIEYTTHVQSYGWLDYSKNNEMSGTEGEAKRLEAIQIRLTGEMKEHYDIYYRVHAQKFGWLGWAKNDEPAGTAGYAYRLEGIEIQLVEKGQTPKENEHQNDNEAFYENE